MDQNLTIKNFYQRLFDRPVHSSEVDEILETLQWNVLIGSGMLEALLTIKDPEIVTELISVANVITEKTHGARLREEGNSYMAGFLSGSIHGSCLMAHAVKRAPEKQAEASAAMVGFMLVAIGSALREGRHEWPEELDETIQ